MITRNKRRTPEKLDTKGAAVGRHFSASPQFNETMIRKAKQFAAAASLLLIVTGCGTTGSDTSWNYRVVNGWLANTNKGGGTFEQQLNQAAVDGWDIVDVSYDANNGPFAVVRRHKK